MFTLEDNTKAVLARIDGGIERALERIGLKAEDYATKLVPVAEEYGGTLRDSIKHKVDTGEKTVYLGSNEKYAPYVELGTGIYAEGGGGRPTPWAYQDEKGEWHHTRGQKPQPYLRPAIEDHKQTYRNILEDELASSLK